MPFIMMNPEYRPNVAILMITDQCNIACDHCIVDARPDKQGTLPDKTVDMVLSQAKDSGIKLVCIYGGEPFLRVRDLLPRTLDKTLASGFDVSIGTNGFWGRSDSQAGQTLGMLENLAARHDRRIAIGISADRYHRRFIPPDSLARIIKTFRTGDFHHISLGLQTFVEEESWSAVGEVYDACRDMGVILISSNDDNFAYPALKEEFIEFTEDNFPDIRRHLGLPAEAHKEWIATDIFYKHKADPDSATVISRRLDLGYGVRNYLIFPDERYLIQIAYEDVISAGRARGSNPLHFGAAHAPKDIQYILFAPDGNAYSVPAQVAEKINPVEVDSKPLYRIIYEVGRQIAPLDIL